MTAYPPRDLNPWDVELKDYLESTYLKSGLQTIASVCNSIGINGTLAYYPGMLEATSLGSLSYFGYALPKTNGRFRYVGSYGHVGYTSTQLLAEYFPAALASGADYIELQVPTNDIGSGIPVATTMANVTQMHVRARANGQTVILATMTPLGSPVAGNTGASLTWISTYNLWVKRYAAAQHLPIVDYHAVTVNPADNNPISMGTFWNADGVHPLAPGARAMGNELARVLNSLPAQIRQPLPDSYNPNYMLADAAFTSAGADKWTTSGSTAGGWAHRAIAGNTPDGAWKGNQFVVTRGSGDYSYIGPIQLPWIAGHRIRVAFNIDVSYVPAAGTWSAYLYNFTQSQAILGFAAMGFSMVKDQQSMTVLAGTVTNASKTISSTTSVFKPWHVGKQVTATVGVVGAFAAGAVIDGVSADGLSATVSVAATQTQTGTSIISIHGEPCQSVWEFTVQPDMVGDDIRFATNAGGAVGTTLGVSQVLVADLTALGIA